MPHPRRVVVTGVGVVSALGADVNAFFEALLAGKSGVRTITRFDTSGYAVHFGAQVGDFDEERDFSRRDIRRMDLCTRFAGVAGRRAFEQAGLADAGFDRERAGAIIGTGIGGLQTIEEEHAVLLARGPSRVSPLLIPKIMANSPGGQLAIDLGLGGANFACASACASANHAMSMALGSIRSGESDLVLTGGAEASVCPLALSGFSAMKALSTRNDEPQRASRPFDRDRDGFVVGEGAGVLVFEEQEHAKRRGAAILAEVLGCGQATDAHHITAPHPEGLGGARAIASALRDAGLSPDAVDYVNAHGTATALGDPIETRVIKRVFGAHASKLAVNSTKSLIGHALGAAAALEAVVCVESLRRGVLHPTANLEHPDPECDLDYVPSRARELPIRVALSNALGFGGHNCVLLFGRFEG